MVEVNRNGNRFTGGDGGGGRGHHDRDHAGIGLPKLRRFRGRGKEDGKCRKECEHVFHEETLDSRTPFKIVIKY